MLENVYEGLNARPKVYSSKEYFCEMYPTCVSSKLCEFISLYVDIAGSGDPLYVAKLCNRHSYAPLFGIFLE